MLLDNKFNLYMVSWNIAGLPGPLVISYIVLWIGLTTENILWNIYQTLKGYKRGESIQTLNNSVQTSACKSVELTHHLCSFSFYVLRDPYFSVQTLSISRNSYCMCWILEVTIFPFNFYLYSVPSALAFPLWS